MNKFTKVAFKLLDLIVIFVMTFSAPVGVLAGPSPTGATITTQLPDYPPGATVLMTGAGWVADEGVHVVVSADDQSWALESSPDPVADSAGGFTYEFTLPNWFVPSYTVSATGFTSGTATVSFTDLNIGTYDQCANDDKSVPPGTGYTSGDTGCRWINGNLQSNTAYYAEGDATVQRVWLTDFTPGPHTLTLQYGTTQGGKHAYDFLTTWDWSEDWIVEADRCQGITGCVGLAESKLDIPQDPNVPDSFEPSAPGDRQFVMRGATLTSATTPVIESGSYAGNSETIITISFTVPNSGPMCSSSTSCSVALWFGAHVSAQANWGLGLGAGSISGSPYHVALYAVDGASVGKRDNQMQSAVVTQIANGTIVIVKDAVPNDAQDFSFNLNNNSTISQNFLLDDDADATLPNSQTFSVPPGTWYATELGLPITGWNFTNLVCTVTGTNGSTTTVDLATAKATINLKSNDTVTCTYTNTKLATAQVKKVTVPAGSETGWMFDLKDSGGNILDTKTTTGSGFIAFTPYLAAGSYTIVEHTQSGWTSDGGSGCAFTVAYPADGGKTFSCTFTNTKGLALTATKTADGTYDRTVTWTLTKSASPTSLSGVAGGSAGSTTWTIVADKTETFGNYKVTGSIVISNSNAYAVPVTVSDLLSDATVATVTCPVTGNNTGSVPANGSLTCTYSASPTGKSASNTATITSGDPNVGGTTASADVTWKETLKGYDSGLLEDTHLGISETISGDTTKTPSESFTCPSDVSLYKDGKYSYRVPNTATLDSGINLSASASVTVDCTIQPLVPTKTAAGTWDRTVTWTLEKSVVETSYSGVPGDEFKPTWTVNLTKIVDGPKNFVVKGTISVANPGAIAQSFSVADTLSDGTVATVTCPDTNDNTGTVAAGATVVCSYVANPANANATKNTATISMTGNPDQVAYADISWSENLTGSDSGNLTDPRFTYEQTKSDSTTVTFNETFSCSTDPNDYTNGSYTTSFKNDAYFKNINTDLHADASVGLTCHLAALTATKDATATYKQDINWDLQKTVDDPSHSGFAGQDAGTSTWTVTATKTIGAPYGWLVTGKIYIHNPATIGQTFSVSDVLDDMTAADVTCPEPAVVPAGGDVECSYTASPAAGNATKNTATITAVGNPAITAEADVDYGSIHVGSETAVLEDGLIEYKETINQTTVETWDQTFSCSSDQSSYTDGKYSYDVTNTATLKFGTETLTKNVKVGVDCTLKPLEPSKTAAGTWDRTVTWTLAKSVDPASHEGHAGDSFDSTWTVKLTKIVDGPKNFVVTGTISVVNPGAIAQSFSVADTLSDGTVATVTCPITLNNTGTVAAGNTVVCSYTASPADASATKNTATISMTGNPDQVAYADISWSENLTGSDSGNLTDPRFTYNGNVSYTTSVDFKETFTCSTDPNDYTNGSYTTSFKNDAYFKNVNSDLSASAEVGLTCHLAALTARKDATATYKQDITWTLDKIVSDDSHSGFAGQDAGTSTWTVTATKTIGAPYGWLVTGTIYIHNPATIAQTFSVSDVLDDGTNATVTCSVPAVVPAGGDVTCTYTASPLAGNATKNTATVTAVGNADITAEAAVNYGSIHVGSETAVLEDGLYNYKETIDKTTVLTWDQTFSCSSDQSSYTNGSYDYDVTNTATLKFGTETLTRNVTVGVDCTLPHLVPTKTANASYDRTVTWTLKKSVDPASFTGFAGDKFNSTWTVVADKTAVEDNFKISGTISVYNPSAITQTFTVADKLDDGTPVTVSCLSNTVEAGKTVECTYEAFPNSYNAKLNTATITATGNADQTTTADVKFVQNLIGYEGGDLSDTRFSFNQSITDDFTKTFPETFTCPTSSDLYKDGIYTTTYNNTAHLNGNINLDASAKVDLSCYMPQIDLTKTGATLSKIGDLVTYTFKLENLTPTAWGMRDLSCTISDPTIGFTKTVTLASGASDTSTKAFTIPTNASDPFKNTASVTCKPLGSTFSVGDSSQWSTNLFQPGVEILKSGPFTAAEGDTVTYSFTINNKSSSDSPNLVFGDDGYVKDDVLGDLTALAKAAGCDNLVWNGTCTFTKTYTVPYVGILPHTITNVVSVLYHPFGFPNKVEDTDTHSLVLVPKSQLTDTMYCPLPNNQFRLIYQAETASTFKLQASNPGQFYYNAFYYGAAGSTFTMTIQIPYPFMTQEGAGVPIQVHDNSATNSNGCYVPSPMLSGYTITTQALTPVSASGTQIITPEDYTTKQIGGLTTVTVGGKVPATGIVYVTIHLDYGLKKTGSWIKGALANDPRNPVIDTTTRYDATNNSGFGSGPVTIKGYQAYSFSRTVGSDSATSNPYSINEIKKFAGFLGDVATLSTEQPIPNATVQIIGTDKKTVLANLLTDIDGYYMFPYKHTAKSATYYVKLIYGKYTVTTPVIVKANGFGIVNFEVP